MLSIPTLGAWKVFKRFRRCYPVCGPDSSGHWSLTSRTSAARSRTLLTASVLVLIGTSVATNSVAGTEPVGSIEAPTRWEGPPTPSHNIAVGSPSVTLDVSEEEIERIARDKGWLRLLHYRNARGFGLSRSRVISRDFFLHPRGHRDPEAELRALLDLRSKAGSDEAARAAYCRFPARTGWVESQLGVHPTLRLPCPSSPSGTAKRDMAPNTLVFVTGYLGNPASAFGHVLLAEDSTSDEAGKTDTGASNSATSPLLSDALNYGALVPTGENPVRYAMRGLLGGYHASFAPRQAHIVHHQYRELENRTLWAFPLQLTPDQADLLSLHLRELESAHFRYFFVRDNCGFEIIELLAVVQPEARPATRPWSLPIDALFAAERAGLVAPRSTAVSAWLARDQRFRTAFEALSRTERRRLRSVFRRGTPEGSSLTELSAEAIDAGLLFAELLEDSDGRQDWRAALLAARISRPSTVHTTNPPAQYSPLDRPPASSAAAGVAYDDRWTPTLRVQVGYQDLLTQNIDRSEWGVFRVGDLRVSAPEAEARVDEFELLAVERFGTASTGMPGDRGSSWGLKVSPYIRLNNGDQGASIGGQWGWFLDVGSRSGLFVLAKAEGGWFNSGPSLDVGPAVGLLVHPARWIGVEVRGEWMALGDSVDVRRAPVSQTTLRFGSHPRTDVRITANVSPTYRSVHPQWVWHW